MSKPQRLTGLYAGEEMPLKMIMNVQASRLS